jgi:hypothetical protein
MGRGARGRESVGSPTRRASVIRRQQAAGVSDSQLEAVDVRILNLLEQHTRLNIDSAQNLATLINQVDQMASLVERYDGYSPLREEIVSTPQLAAALDTPKFRAARHRVGISDVGQIFLSPEVAGSLAQMPMTSKTKRTYLRQRRELNTLTDLHKSLKAQAFAARDRGDGWTYIRLRAMSIGVFRKRIVASASVFTTVMDAWGGKVPRTAARLALSTAAQTLIASESGTVSRSPKQRESRQRLPRQPEQGVSQLPLEYVDTVAARLRRWTAEINHLYREGMLDDATYRELLARGPGTLEALII